MSISLKPSTIDLLRAETFGGLEKYIQMRSQRAGIDLSKMQYNPTFKAFPNPQLTLHNNLGVTIQEDGWYVHDYKGEDTQGPLRKVDAMKVAANDLLETFGVWIKNRLTDITKTNKIKLNLNLKPCAEALGIQWKEPTVLRDLHGLSVTFLWFQANHNATLKATVSHTSSTIQLEYTGYGRIDAFDGLIHREFTPWIVPGWEHVLHPYRSFIADLERECPKGTMKKLVEESKNE